jgi:hypothetical protein
MRDNLENHNKLFFINEMKRSLPKLHDTAVGPYENTLPNTLTSSRKQLKIND